MLSHRLQFLLAALQLRQDLVRPALTILLTRLQDTFKYTQDYRSLGKSSGSLVPKDLMT